MTRSFLAPPTYAALRAFVPIHPGRTLLICPFCRSAHKCAHRNRPLRYDGRVVVTLCAEEIGVPARDDGDLEPAAGPGASGRRGHAPGPKQQRTWRSAARRSLPELLPQPPTFRASTACTWRRQRETCMSNSETMLSVLHYGSHCTADNTPAVEKSTCTETSEHAPTSADPPAAAPASPGIELPLQPLPAACPAASHQLLWRWSAGSWHCRACGGRNTWNWLSETNH